MGVFQASMLEAKKSLLDEMQSMKKSAQEVVVHQTSTSASKPGTSKQTDTLPPNTAWNTRPSEHTDEAMELNVYGQPLPARFGDDAFTTTFRGYKMSRSEEFTILAFLLVQVSTSQGGRRLPKKAPLRNHRVSDPISISPFVVP